MIQPKQKKKISKKKQLLKILKKNWPIITILLFILILFQLGNIGIIIFMGITAIVFRFYKYIIPENLGIELLTFYAAIISIAINPMYGIIFSIVVIIANQIFEVDLNTFIVVKMAVYAGICASAPIFGLLGIAKAGIIISILRNVVFVLINLKIAPTKALDDLKATIINTIVNIFLFTNFGVFTLGLFN